MRLALILAVLVMLPVRGEPELQTEYKQADTSYYLLSDLEKTQPSAPVLNPSAATNIGGSYLITTRPHPPEVMYLSQTHDWLEPITPPDMPASLNCPPDAMQVREPQGSVQVALPSAPASFNDVRPGVAIPNGAVLRTGDDSSVAVLFGGVDSVRLAPGTQAAVQMNVIGGVRDVEVDVRHGMVFSKVGQRIGEKEAYAVHTPFGNATAHGTDYVTVVLPRRVDVWVAQGTVGLTSPDGTSQVTASTGNEPLKVMRYPLAAGGAEANAESAESLTALLNFIPMANQKLAALASRSHGGERLTATEKAYMGRIRKVTALIRLATIDAPASVIAATAPAPVKSVIPPSQPRPATVAIASVKEPAYPKAKPLVLAPVVHKPAVAATTPPAHLKAAAPATPLAVTTAAKPKKSSHPKPAVVADETSPWAPPPDAPFPRAKPVDPADVVAAPTVMNTPPPARAPVAAAPSDSSAEMTDPNSLGAQLNPFHNTPTGAPNPGLVLRPAGTPESETSSLGGVAGKVEATSP